MLITEATTPTHKDIRRRNYFERQPWGHAWIAHQRWLASRKTTRYLGEWHTHAEDIPSPSGTDRQEWLRLSQKRIDYRPLLSIIVGRVQLHVELTSRTGQAVQFTPVQD